MKALFRCAWPLSGLLATPRLDVRHLHQHFTHMTIYALLCGCFY